MTNLKTILMTGSNSGIGLELVKESYLKIFLLLELLEIKKILKHSLN